MADPVYIKACKSPVDDSTCAWIELPQQQQVFPPLTAQEGAEIATACILCWLVGAGLREIIKFIRSNTHESE